MCANYFLISKRLHHSHPNSSIGLFPAIFLEQTAVAAGSTQSGSGGTQAKVAVLQFDQKTGKRLNDQVSFELLESSNKSPVEVPWKSWHMDHTGSFTAATHKLAVVTMLENIHRQWDVSTVDVKIMYCNGKTSVAASANLQKNQLTLPPAVPKGCKVHDSTHENPQAVPVSVSLSDCANAEGEPTQQNKLFSFLLTPELKIPQPKATPAVAASESEILADPDRAGAPEWLWSKDQSESIYPFWGVRRLTEAALKQEQDSVTAHFNKTGQEMPMPAFNCEITTRTFTDTLIAIAGGQNVTTTRSITIPIITNTKDVLEGEELIMCQAAFSKAKKVRARDWRDVVKKESLEEKKQMAKKLKT